MGRCAFLDNRGALISSIHYINIKIAIPILPLDDETAEVWLKKKWYFA